MPKRSKNASQAVIAVNWECYGLGEVQALRLVADNALIDKMKLAISTWTSNASSIIHFVPGLEQRTVPANLFAHSGNIPSQDAGTLINTPPSPLLA